MAGVEVLVDAGEAAVDRDDPIVEIAAPADYVPRNLGRDMALEH